jgi:hypothetical protein
LRDREKEYQRRDVQPLLVLAQQAFQLKRPPVVDKEWAWPGEVPPEVLFDPVSTVSATYGVAFQTQFRDDQNVWSSRPAIFVIDRDGVVRHVEGHPDEDIREEGIFPALDDLEEQRRLITALEAKGGEQRAAARAALAPLGPDTAAAIPTLVKSLKDKDAAARAGAAAALVWMPRLGEPAVPALTLALNDEDHRVRRLAAMAVGRLGTGAKTAVTPLVGRLTDDDPRVRAEAETALERIGPAGAAGLWQALKHTDPRLRAAAALFSLRENAIVKEPGLGYAERWWCVSRLGASMVA